ncbi:hypothetical protein SORBI_3008G093700 [Sorghum bicolor]|uniref:Uncharacterized protein n=1 Tax=Sorghum bicolor TaxID=4558 RepID=A0A1Z5R5P1_SORBI|nr:hypothetical protein SORBI_3008G093700 [Sorghum bicolor]
MPLLSKNLTEQKKIEKNYGASHNIYGACMMQRKFNNEPGFKESRQSFCFKAKPLPNFYRRNRQPKDPSHQTTQEIPSSSKSGRNLLSDVNEAHQAGKGASDEKQICCFPIRKMY